MKEQVLLMTEKESKIIKYVKKSIVKKITQKVAAKKLNMSTRNFRRKVASYKKYGDSGIISKKRDLFFLDKTILINKI